MYPSSRAAYERQFMALQVELFPPDWPDPPGLPVVNVPLSGVLPTTMSEGDWVAVGIAGALLTGVGLFLATR
jgi:hypothetical protein